MSGKMLKEVTPSEARRPESFRKVPRAVTPISIVELGDSTRPAIAKSLAARRRCGRAAGLCGRRGFVIVAAAPRRSVTLAAGWLVRSHRYTAARPEASAGRAPKVSGACCADVFAAHLVPSGTVARCSGVGAVGGGSRRKREQPAVHSAGALGAGTPSIRGSCSVHQRNAYHRQQTVTVFVDRGRLRGRARQRRRRPSSPKSSDEECARHR